MIMYTLIFFFFSDCVGIFVKLCVKIILLRNISALLS